MRFQIYRTDNWIAWNEFQESCATLFLFHALIIHVCGAVYGYEARNISSRPIHILSSWWKGCIFCLNNQFPYFIECCKNGVYSVEMCISSLLNSSYDFLILNLRSSARNGVQYQFEKVIPKSLSLLYQNNQLKMEQDKQLDLWITKII